ncbi:myb-like protein X isoform X1 [Neocloeon triangulifer]|uniref:myb-like protein X isoform X1 n=1 Tax=Neocloeon triangulifer TaxID=2078957 RepID=UPI00286EC700|nr:myb-like protein X isoform X1 [Neocloeon triangulifer]
MGRRFVLLFGIFAFLHFSAAAAVPDSDTDHAENPECKDTEKIAEIGVGVKEFNDNGKKAFEAVHGQLTLVQSLLYLVVDKQETLEKRVECSPVGANVSNELQLLRQVSILTREKTDLAERAQESNKCCSEQVPQKDEEIKQLKEKVEKIAQDKTESAQKDEEIKELKEKVAKITREKTESAQKDVEIKQLKEKVARVSQEKTESEEQHGKELEKVKLALEKWENATSDELKNLAEEKHRAEIEAKCKRSRSTPLVELNGKKYYFQLLKTDPFLGDWQNKKDKCERKGLELVTIKDEDELKVVAEHALTLEDYFWWVSAKNYGDENNYDFRWLDGTKLEKNSPLWGPNPEKKHCVYLSKKSLFSDSCDRNQRYICQLPKECY